MKFSASSILLPLFACLLLLPACQTPEEAEREATIKRRQKEAQAVVDQWMGQKFPYPKGLPFVYDSTSQNWMGQIEQASYKVVTFVDGGCSVCIPELKHWNTFINEVQEITDQVAFHVYVYAGNENDFQEDVINKVGYEYPWIHDEASSYLKETNIHDKLYYTALLNEKDEVVLIGNPFTPFVNEPLRDLYKKAITELSTAS